MNKIKAAQKKYKTVNLRRIQRIVKKRFTKSNESGEKWQCG